MSDTPILATVLGTKVMPYIITRDPINGSTRVPCEPFTIYTAGGTGSGGSKTKSIDFPPYGMKAGVDYIVATKNKKQPLLQVRIDGNKFTILALADIHFIKCAHKYPNSASMGRHLRELFYDVKTLRKGESHVVEQDIFSFQLRSAYIGHLIQTGTTMRLSTDCTLIAKR